MKFVAPEQAPEQAEIIRNTPFWPDVDLSEFRSVMRTDGTVTQPRLKQVALISDAKPCSRHMIGMSINLQTSGPHWVGVASYLGEEITIYPYINETIISGGTAHEGGAVHVIDTMRVNP